MKLFDKRIYSLKYVISISIFCTASCNEDPQIHNKNKKSFAVEFLNEEKNKSDISDFITNDINYAYKERVDISNYSSIINMSNTVLTILCLNSQIGDLPISDLPNIINEYDNASTLYDQSIAFFKLFQYIKQFQYNYEDHQNILELIDDNEEEELRKKHIQLFLKVENLLFYDKKAIGLDGIIAEIMDKIMIETSVYDIMDGSVVTPENNDALKWIFREIELTNKIIVKYGHNRCFYHTNDEKKRYVRLTQNDAKKDGNELILRLNNLNHEWENDAYKISELLQNLEVIDNDCLTKEHISYILKFIEEKNLEECREELKKRISDPDFQINVINKVKFDNINKNLLDRINKIIFDVVQYKATSVSENIVIKLLNLFSKKIDKDNKEKLINIIHYIPNETLTKDNFISLVKALVKFAPIEDLKMLYGKLQKNTQLSDADAQMFISLSPGSLFSIPCSVEDLYICIEAGFKEGIGLKIMSKFSISSSEEKFTYVISKELDINEVKQFIEKVLKWSKVHNNQETQLNIVRCLKRISTCDWDADIFKIFLDNGEDMFIDYEAMKEVEPKIKQKITITFLSKILNSKKNSGSKEKFNIGVFNILMRMMESKTKPADLKTLLATKYDCSNITV